VWLITITEESRDGVFLVHQVCGNLILCYSNKLMGCWQVLCELPASGNWNFDVQWSPCTPGVLSTSSFDGQIGIYNIEACSRTRSNNSIFGGDLSAYDYSAGWVCLNHGVSMLFVFV
jgi:hypothetical protein